MEWLRSCYIGQWRLFRNSNVLTRGYYYFCSPQTPFYPGGHNLGSRNWTTEDFQDPPLGEASGQRMYRKGDFPATLPPIGFTGNSDCISRGDLFPVVGISRTLVAGVDSGCYSQVGAVVPDQLPAVLLQSSDLASVTNAQPAFSWSDRSIYVNGPGTSDPTFAPLGSVMPGRSFSLTFAPTSRFPLQRSVNLPGDYLLSFVGNVSSGSLGSNPVLVGIGPNGAVAQIGANSVAVTTTHGLATVATTNNFDANHVWVIRRVGLVTTVSRDGVVVALVVDSVPFALVVTDLIGFVQGQAGEASLRIADWRIFDQGLGNSAAVSLQAALLAAYPSVSTVAVACGLCATAAAAWSLTVAGYTGAAAPLNGTWTLSYVDTCFWSSPGSVDPLWELNEEAGTWVLNGAATAGINSQFIVNDADWACVDVNVMPYNNGNADTGHPSSLILVPF